MNKKLIIIFSAILVVASIFLFEAIGCIGLTMRKLRLSLSYAWPNLR